MKLIGDIVGVIMALTGLFWVLQGTGVVPVGFMARQAQWVVIGLVVAVVGVGILVYTHRRAGGNPRITG